jgi:hypothetical protein
MVRHPNRSNCFTGKPFSRGWPALGRAICRPRLLSYRCFVIEEATLKRSFVFFLCATVVATASVVALASQAARPNANLWTPIAADSLAKRPDVPVADGSYTPYRLDVAALEATLRVAPDEAAGLEKSLLPAIALPLPDGTQGRFAFAESPIMEPELAAKFPEILTFVAQGLDDATATARFDLTPAGFHAQIISASGTVYVDPYRRGAKSVYVSYDRRGYLSDTPMECELLESPEAPLPETFKTGDAGPTSIARAGTLRTYRLACGATGEYTAYHGGTKSAAMAAIVTAVNRVDGVYEREVAVRLVLVANNDQIVYTSASQDPYSNTNGSTMLGQNQTVCDSIIGSANYDIGHVFSTGGGGVAYLRSVCNSSIKAGGVTGLSAPTGDAFYIDYVAHEMGHQFGGNHTFNDCGSQLNASTAYEPGSGSTIMAYAGICGSADVQAHSDDYFHGVSLDEIYAHITGAGGCGANTGNSNTAPSANAGADFTIPVGTPFTLTGSGADANGDALTYCWEEWDLGSVTSSTKPVIRSLAPSTSPSRTIPRMSDLLAGAATPWEALPTAARTLNFRLSVRDNRAGGGGIADDYSKITVAGTQSFAVTSPNTAVTWGSGTTQTVSWSVAGTNVSPFNVSAVNIRLSTDGGASWTTLAAGTPNDGSQAVTLPAVSSSSCRILVEAVGNIFFDLSNTSFTIGAAGPTAPAAPSNLVGTAAGTSRIDLSWNDNSTDETSFKIERKASKRGSWVQVATIGGVSGTGTASYSDTGLSGNTSYSYRVRASNSAGDSGYSNEVTVKTLRR